MRFGQKTTTIVRRTYTSTVQRAPSQNALRTSPRRVVVGTRPTPIRRVVRRSTVPGRPSVQRTIFARQPGRIGEYVPGVTLNRNAGLRPREIWFH